MIKLGVIFGGESVEHEVSIISAIQAMNKMDSEKYEVIPIYITKEGEWYTGKSLKDIEDKTWLNNYELSDIFKFVSQEVVNDITFYKFKQVYQDIPFLYHSITVSVDKDYHVSSFGGWYYNHKVHVETTPKKTKDEIKTIAKNVLGKNANIESSELYIEEDSDHNLSLVYVVKGYSDDKALEIIIDANTGEVVSESDLIDNISSTYTGFGIDGITHTITLDEDKELLTGKRIYKFYSCVKNHLQNKITFLIGDSFLIII